MTATLRFMVPAALAPALPRNSWIPRTPLKDSSTAVSSDTTPKARPLSVLSFFKAKRAKTSSRGSSRILASSPSLSFCSRKGTACPETRRASSASTRPRVYKKSSAE